MGSEMCIRDRFLDFDGTLVEIAPTPGAIKPEPDLADKLAALAIRLKGRCAIVSGRAISDIESYVGPLPIAAAGSHGSDIRSADGQSLVKPAAQLPRSIETELRSFAEAQDLQFEKKPHGGALHFRNDPSKGPDAYVFAKALADAQGWAVQSGKCVVEIVARTASKGEAVRVLMESTPFAGATPVFIGDDLTDEAGFAACHELDGFGVLVGAREESAARYGLRDVMQVHKWLEALS